MTDSILPLAVALLLGRTGIPMACALNDPADETP